MNQEEVQSAASYLQQLSSLRNRRARLKKVQDASEGRPLTCITTRESNEDPPSVEFLMPAQFIDTQLLAHINVLRSKLKDLGVELEPEPAP